MVRKILHNSFSSEVEIWAYGSRVNGDCYDMSDLDLVVRQPGNLEKPTKNLAQVRDAFIESNLPIQVQIVDWARIPDSFHKEIEANYFVLIPH